MLEKFLYLSDLFDIYGSLLTEKQQRCLQMSLYEDFSLSEIAGELGISRQAVYDNLHRSEQIMKGYEEKLQLLKQKEVKEKASEEMREAIGKLDSANAEQIKKILLAKLDILLK